METRTFNENDNSRKKIFIWPFYFCFLIFGILSALGKQEITLLNFSLSIVLSMVVGLLIVNFLILLLRAFNKNLINKSGTVFAKEAVGKGMAFMIPFTVLAMLVFFVLDWNVIMPFASAAITTSAANAGTEVIKKGGNGLKNMIIPTALAMFLSTVWMLLLAFLP
ncbi:hypothetical protein [Acetobacterium sp.]|uniref:hypothetical protein n=1 Tax=Acetobacterium sp. TaxID=1872094 RepID=UPI002F3EFABC